MAWTIPADDEKKIHWVGSSLDSLREFPEAVQDDVGSAISAAQFGGKAASAKPWTGLSSGVFEIAESYDGNAYRIVYTVRFARAVYVLHAFQKKSQRRIKTSPRDVEAVSQALKQAKIHYQQNYGGKP